MYCMLLLIIYCMCDIHLTDINSMTINVIMVEMFYSVISTELILHFSKYSHSIFSPYVEETVFLEFTDYLVSESHSLQ